MDSTKLLLGTRFLNGARPSQSYSSLDRLGSVPDEAAIATILRQAHRCGIQGILALGDARLLSVLRKEYPAILPEVYPIIPNVLGYVREATDYGMVGAGLRRVRRLGLWRLIMLGIRSVPQAPAILRRDFASMVDVLFELEMADFQHYRPRTVFLHGQITDLALAVGNRRIFRLFAQRMRNRYKVEPGLATYNLGTLIPKLREWAIDINTIYTPIHPSGFLMYPSAIACEQVCRDNSLTIISELIPPNGIIDEHTASYLRRLNIQTASIDMVNPGEMATIAETFHTYRQRN